MDSRRFILVILIVASVPLTWADEAPLVVAVDTSRSLQKTDLEVVHDVLLESFEAIPPDVPIGLVAFDDSARWLATPGTPRTELLASLMAVEPGGSYTVLYDALFLAARQLGGGGIILAISDGRDENSAVKVRDVESLCSRNGVRLVTSGIGRKIDDRALRRLALLTRGPYLGTVEDLTGTTLAEAVTDARTDLLAEQSAMQPTAVPSPGVEEPVSVQESEPQRVADGQESPNGIVLASLAVVFSLVALAVGGWWLFRRVFPASEVCADCGTVIPDGENDCFECEIASVRRAAGAGDVAAAEAAQMTSIDPSSLRLETLPGGIDRTMAIGDLAMLIVREEGQPERSFSMPKNRILAVGRAPRVNTIQVEDATVSAQHFKIVFKNDAFHVVDLGTTNGTMVNQERVQVKRLVTGDVIRAGLTDFHFDAFEPEAEV